MELLRSPYQCANTGKGQITTLSYGVAPPQSYLSVDFCAKLFLRVFLFLSPRGI